MEIREHVALAPFTTFRLGGLARYFAEVSAKDELTEALSFARDADIPLFILGGGSNILVSDDGFPGLVLRMNLSGFSSEEDGSDVLVTVGAGEKWDAVVARSVERGWHGAENLSGIPGTAGAAPVQNIGAYGIESKDIVESVAVLDITSGLERNLSNEECLFGYRDSFFKTEEGKHHIILSVTLRLKRESDPVLSYRDVREYFRMRGITRPSLAEMRDAVLSLRQTKLPMLAEWGTAGCFFQNVLVNRQTAERIKWEYPDMPVYDAKGGFKLPAAYLIDRACGLKGLRKGGAMVNERHGLIIVADEKCTASDVHLLARDIIAAVHDKCGVKLIPEVQYVGRFE